MTNRALVFILLSALVLMLGPAFAGYMVHKGLLQFQGSNNFVTVKGLATQDVESDLVLWPIKHTATGGDLPTVQQAVEENSRKIITFLKSKSLTEKDMVARKIEVTDLLAQQYRSDNATESRFIVSETILVRSNNVDMVDKASQDVGELLKQGVSLVRDQNNANTGYPEYIYTKLNDIKPAMIAEATQSARESASQFARDSDAKVGMIREAWQGTFEILPRDSGNSYSERQERFKTVRVVSTLKFYLE
ncbi:MAG: SIMPL domain-containing protein [Alphaproteobacteria bacterium]